MTEVSKQVAHRANYPEVAQSLKDQARHNGAMACITPDCGKVMKLFITTHNQKNELYCEVCHTSVPLYKIA